jgi:hypothetical protein
MNDDRASAENGKCLTNNGGRREEPGRPRRNEARSNVKTVAAGHQRRTSTDIVDFGLATHGRNAETSSTVCW